MGMLNMFAIALSPGSRSSSANSIITTSSFGGVLTEQSNMSAPIQTNYYSYLNYMMIFLVSVGLFLFCYVIMGVNLFNNLVNIMHLNDYNILGLVFELTIISVVALTAYDLARNMKSDDTKGYFFRPPNGDIESRFGSIPLF